MEGSGRTGATSGEGRAEVDGADVEGAGAVDVDGASNLLALDFWVPGKMIEGSPRFQQFFLI